MLEVIFKGFIYLSIAYHVIKWLWRQWVLYKANDPGSEFGDLPIPPGEFGLPVIGETYLWAIQGSKFNSTRRKKYGKAFSTNFLGRTMVKVTGPEYIKTILNISHDDVVTLFPATVREILGENTIANSFHSSHKYKRRIWLKAFTKDALNGYIPIMTRDIRNMLNTWDCSNVVMWNATREFAFSTAQEALVGLKMNNDEERKLMYETFNKMVQNMFALPFKYPGSAFCKGLEARELLHKMLSKHLLKKRIQQEEDYHRMKETNGIKAPEREGLVTGLQHMMDAENEIKLRNENNGEKLEPESDLALVEGVVEMIFAGYLTTASTTTSLVKNLIEHPQVFKKIEEELIEHGLISSNASQDSQKYLNNNNSSSSAVEEVTENKENEQCEDCNKLPSNITFQSTSTRESSVLNQNTANNIDLNMLNSLKYLNQVIRETLRYSPPILGTYRRTLKTIQLGKYRIPKGWTIILNIRDTHESEWDDVITFNPDNFAAENWKESKENRYRYLPFGGGDRLCIGKEFARTQIKLLIIELIKKYKTWEFIGGIPPKMYPIPMLHPRNGMPIKFTPR